LIQPEIYPVPAVAVSAGDIAGHMAAHEPVGGGFLETGPNRRQITIPKMATSNQATAEASVVQDDLAFLAKRAAKP